MQHRDRFFFLVQLTDICFIQGIHVLSYYSGCKQMAGRYAFNELYTSKNFLAMPVFRYSPITKCQALSTSCWFSEVLLSAASTLSTNASSSSFFTRRPVLLLITTSPIPPTSYATTGVLQ